MKETPILMSTDMVKAILDNHKTLTRRTYGLEWVNKDPDAWKFLRMEGDLAVFQGFTPPYTTKDIPMRSFPKKIETGPYKFDSKQPPLFPYIRCPYGQVGDELWIKETWTQFPDGKTIIYKADGKPYFDVWKSSMFMPRRVSRITLEITGIRAERLQKITTSDIKAEGFNISEEYRLGGIAGGSLIIETFTDYWNKLNKKRGYSWDLNKWVWPIEFKRTK